MAVKLTKDDPAEDLTSDAAIATFMAEAFATEDPGYTRRMRLGSWRVRRVWRRSPNGPDFRANSSIGRSAKQGNPTLKTTIAVMKALGVELTAQDSGVDGRLPRPSDQKPLETVVRLRARSHPQRLATQSAIEERKR